MTKGKEEETMKREGSAPKESGGKAQRIYRIGLAICASNFERHQIMIRAVHRALKEKGPYEHHFDSQQIDGQGSTDSQRMLCASIPEQTNDHHSRCSRQRRYIIQ